MGEVNIDKDNAIEITSLKIQLEAVEDKILVLVDSYKSGYECNTCKQTGRVPSGVVEGATKDCPDCNGKGVLLEIPQIAKSLPTLGTVVSLGPKTQWISRFQTWACKECGFAKLEDLEKSILIRPGAKVLFQPHVGTLIPFKGNIRIKAMREHEPLCVIYGSELDTKDFMDFDTPFEQRY